MGRRTVGWHFERLVVREGLRRLLSVIGRGSRGLQAIRGGPCKDTTKRRTGSGSILEEKTGARREAGSVYPSPEELLEEMDNVFKV